MMNGSLWLCNLFIMVFRDNPMERISLSLSVVVSLFYWSSQKTTAVISISRAVPLRTLTQLSRVTKQRSMQELTLALGRLNSWGPYLNLPPNFLILQFSLTVNSMRRHLLLFSSPMAHLHILKQTTNQLHQKGEKRKEKEKKTNHRQS